MGDSLHPTAPREGNLVSVPIIYVKEKEPCPRYVAEKQKGQTQEINAPHKPKPKVQDTKKRATWTKIERNTSSMVEDSNGGEGVGRKRRHKGETEDDTAEIFGAGKRQKPLEDSNDLLSMVVAVSQPCRAQ